MTPPSIASLWPWAALALLGLALVVGLRWAGKYGLWARPVWPLAILVAALAPVDVLLVWLNVLPDNYLRFGRPGLAPVGLLAVLVAAALCLRGGSRLSRLRTTLSDAATAVTILSASLVAMVPEVGLPLDRMTVVVLIDRSRSIDLVPHGEERILRELATAEWSMRPEDRVGRVVFAGDSASEELPRLRSAPSTPQRIEVARDASDVAAGIRRALADLPADSAGRIVLMSDGVATRGDALSAAGVALTSGVPVDVVTLEQRELKDVRLASLRLPTTVNEAEPVRLRLVVASPAATEVELRIRRDGALVRRVSVQVEVGENVLSLSEPSPGPGMHRFDVELTALDPAVDECAEDNAAAAFVRVRGKARALVLDGDVGKTAFVASALRAAEFEVEEGGATAVPTDVAGMAAYDLIVLGDIAASVLAGPQLDALAAYVRDLGGGLLLLGGDRSFGPGGYSGTPIEELSPVSFDLKQDRRRASLAEVIAIDISGSMTARVGARTKLELANEAAARSAALLGAGDMLGVDHVDTLSHWTVPLGPVVDSSRLADAIRKMGAGGGGIDVEVGLVDAYAALEKVTVQLKHVLLFADGADAENITPGLKATVAEAERRGITTSVVALGKGSDVADCEILARLGKGRFYLIEDANRLPSVFTQETILASHSALVEEPFRVARASNHSVLQGIDVEAAPLLGGYVVTIAKPRAEVILSGPDHDPILSHWQVGVGHSAVFTSDLKSRWGGAWTGWQGAARLVAQLARHLARHEDDRRVRFESEVVAGQLDLRATVIDDDGRSSSFRRLKAMVHGPSGFAREVPLEAHGSGTYRALLPLAAPGAYIATALDELDGSAVGMAGAVLSQGDELRPTGSDRGFLTRLAQFTGGKERDTLAGIFDDRGARRFLYEDVTSRLLGFAALAWLAAVAARRLALIDDIGASFMSRWRRRRHIELPAPAQTARARRRASVASDLASAPGEPVPGAAPVPVETPSPVEAPSEERFDATGRALTAAEILLARKKRRL